MISSLFPLNRLMSTTIALAWFTSSFLLSNVNAVRECRIFTDSAGRRRRTCSGLLPGIIAAVVVGVIVILGFASLAWILRRRRQRTRLQNQPVFTHESVNHLMCQPPSYPPPNYPLATMQNQPHHLPREHHQEKHESDPTQPPPQVTLAQGHPNQ